MKSIISLVAIIVSLPFLECLCVGGELFTSECNHCENSSRTQLPSSSHDCLDIVEFFTTSDPTAQPFINPETFILGTKTGAADSFITSVPADDQYTWFGKLKSHLALNIIRV